MAKIGGTRRKRRVKQLFCGRPWVECHYCGEVLTPFNATVDHIIPQANGGLHNVSNLLLACKKCNSKRGCVPYQKYIKRIAA